MNKLNFPPLKGLLCFFYYDDDYLRGHLFHGLRLHPEARVTSQAIADFCPVRSSRHLDLSSSPGDRESPLHSRERTGRNTLQRSCKVGSAMPAPRRDAQRLLPAPAAPGETRSCSRSVPLGLLRSLRGFQAAAPRVAATTLSRGREGDGVPNSSAPAPPRALSGAELPPQPSGRPRPAPPPPPPSPPPQLAPPPASWPSPAAAAEPLRLGGVRGSRAAALGPTARGGRQLIPRTA